MGMARRIRRQMARQKISTTEKPRTPRMFLDDNMQPFAFIEAQSRSWEPMQRLGTFHFPQLSEGWQDGSVWRNRWYKCLARSFPHGFPIDDSMYMVLGITHVTETSHHDWRDFQRIKNDICGPEWEGLELYPAESRLVDPSNRFYLWCVPKGVIQWGLKVEGRRVWDFERSQAPQRPFADEERVS